MPDLALIGTWGGTSDPKSSLTSSKFGQLVYAAFSSAACRVSSVDQRLICHTSVQQYQAEIWNRTHNRFIYACPLLFFPLLPSHFLPALSLQFHLLPFPFSSPTFSSLPPFRFSHPVSFPFCPFPFFFLPFLLPFFPSPLLAFHLLLFSFRGRDGGAYGYPAVRSLVAADWGSLLMVSS